MFSLASVSQELRKGIVTAALPGEVAEVHVRATGGAPFWGRLVRSPAAIPTDSTFLVVFLPPQTDIVDAQGLTAEGEPVNVGRLVDLVDDY